MVIYRPSDRKLLQVSVKLSTGSSQKRQDIAALSVLALYLGHLAQKRQDTAALLPDSLKIRCYQVMAEQYQ